MKQSVRCLLVLAFLAGCNGAGYGSSYQPSAPGIPDAGSPPMENPGAPAPVEQPPAQESSAEPAPPAAGAPPAAPAAPVAPPGAHAMLAPPMRHNSWGASFMMIADQYNNRVVEIDHAHKVIWHFGDGSSVAGPHSVVAPNDEEAYGDLVLIAGTGAPAGSEPSCKKACQDDRVIVVNHAGSIVWQYGKTGVPGSGANELNTPVAAIKLHNGHYLITDQGNQRIIEVTPDKKIVWQYGTTGKGGSGPNQLNNPNSAEVLPNGHVLVADENNNRVIEVTRKHRIVWQYGSPKDTSTLNGAAFASRLPNGDTLITDSLNNRIVEVDASKHVVWTYVTNKRAGSVANPNPTRAVRLRDGDTLVCDQLNQQVIDVDSKGAIDFTEGQVGVAGSGFDQLDAPYDAKIVGDFTGLTPP